MKVQHYIIYNRKEKIFKLLSGYQVKEFQLKNRLNARNAQRSR